MKVLNEINIFHFWEEFDFHYMHPETLSEKESAYIEVKNPAYDDNWALPKTITGWIVIEGWFSNMIEGQKGRSEEHTSELQSRENLVCRLLLEKKKKTINS